MTSQSKLAVAVVLGLLIAYGGFWVADAIEAKKQLRETRAQLLKLQFDQAQYDALVGDNIQEGAAVDAAVASTNNKRREMKANDPTYREYLDRPLPAESKQLYQHAAKAIAAARNQRAGDAGAAAE